MEELIPVRMRDCACPGAPHAEGDFAYLKPRADIAVGLAVHQVVYNSVDSTQQNGSSLTPDQAFGQMQIKLGMAYTVHGIARWDLLDEHGKPLDIASAILNGKVGWTEVMPVADKAATLYSEEVLVPLAASLRTSSPRGQTRRSTSAKTRSSRGRRKR